MTLIEVLAGLALLASLLGGLLLVKARSGRQWSAANRRLEAVAAADGLLSSWWRSPREMPRDDSGPVPDHDAMFWRTRLVENADTRALGARVVRLQIVSDPGAPDATELTRVDVLLPSPATKPSKLPAPANAVSRRPQRKTIR